MPIFVAIADSLPFFPCPRLDGDGRAGPLSGRRAEPSEAFWTGQAATPERCARFVTAVFPPTLNGPRGWSDLTRRCEEAVAPRAHPEQ
jgi:hypothetical protein